MHALRVLPIGSAALLLTSCDSPYSTLRTAGSEADLLASLGGWLSLFMLLVVLVMAALVVWGALRQRGSLLEHLPIDADGGKRWILIGGVLIPVVVLSTLFFITLGTLNALAGRSDKVDLEIEVAAHQWWWEVTYLDPVPANRFKTANEIHIPVGQKVGIRLKAPDVIHSFWVPKLHGKLDAIPGLDNYLIIQAQEPGIYPGQCAEYCGVQHANMHFVVVAQRPEEYRQWVARQRQPAAPPSDPVLQRGQAAFEQYACAICHRVRGTRALGGVAPDLTHFGSRLTIAGVMPNTRARLQAWIVDAQGIKPGAKMPTLEQFDGPTLNALAAYLESLE